MKKGLIAGLIAANVIMLVVGILTILPNLRAEAERISCAEDGAHSACHTCRRMRERPLHRRRRKKHTR